MRAKTTLLLIFVVALSTTPLARADGDPASDYLLAQSTFVPPDDGVPPAYATQLQETVREAKARGYTIRVALVGRLYDMGAVTVLFKRPKQYARFLGEELSFVYKGRLLVVMPNGLATSRNGKALPAEQKVVDRLGVPGPQGASLAATATEAVIRLAADSGIVVPKATLSNAGRSDPNENHDRVTIAAAALVAGLLVAGFVLFRRRRVAA